MPENEQKFLSDLQSDDADARFAAWRRAGQMAPEVIASLGKLVVSDKPGIAKAAQEALKTLVHSVGRQEDAPGRGEVVRRLLELAGKDAPLPARALVFRLLSLVAGGDAAPAVAKWLKDPEAREEAVFCLERIPARGAVQALVASYREAPEDFKPRILAALGHRRAEEAVSVVTEAMRSPNKEIAMAAMKAFGRMGRKPATAPRYPAVAGLSEWQKIEHMDSVLRYADAQVKQGNHAEAMSVYKTALERPEEHWQCAAMTGMARMGTPEAAAAIFPKLKSSQRTVRLTAANVWRGMV